MRSVKLNLSLVPGSRFMEGGGIICSVGNYDVLTISLLDCKIAGRGQGNQ